MARRNVRPSAPKQLSIELLDEHNGIRQGDEVKVKGMVGLYRVGRIYRDKGGVCFDIRGLSRGTDTSRTIDPDRRGIRKMNRRTS